MRVAARILTAFCPKPLAGARGHERCRVCSHERQRVDDSGFVATSASEWMIPAWFVRLTNPETTSNPKESI